MDRRISWSDLGARPALFPALFFGLGALCGGQPESSPEIFLAVAATLGAGALLGARRTGAHLTLLLAFAALGVGLSQLQAQVDVPARLTEGGSAVLEGRVEAATRIADSRRIDLAVTQVDGDPAQFTARLYTRGGSAPLLPGQRIRVRARLKPMEPPLNPGQADFRGAHLRRGLVLTGGFEASSVVALDAPAPSQRWLDEVRRRLATRVRALAPSEEAAALYLTLSAGMRAELDPEVEERFSASGLAHVLSVSGLHVAILAVLLVRLLRVALSRAGSLARTWDVRRVAAPAAIPLVWAYVAFTGNQMPAVRSAVMATAVLLGMAAWKRTDALNALGLAGLAVLWVDPAAIVDLSCALSFLAVASLILIAPALRDAVPVDKPQPSSTQRLRYHLEKLRETCLGTFCASAAVTAVGAPLIAHVFQRLSLAGLVSNIVCLPLCGALTVAAAGGAGLFVAAPALADPVLWVGCWGSELLLWAARVFAALPGASIPVASPGVVAGTLFVTGLFAWALARGRWRWTGVLVPIAVLVAFVPRFWPQPGLVVTFLSVGHGDAIVLSAGGQHALVDGGGSPNGADTGNRYVLPFLREQGIDALNLAVLSHPHPDHALGLIRVLQTLPVERLWVPAGDMTGALGLQVLAAAGEAEVEHVEAGHPAFALGDARVEVLGPPKDRLLLEGVNDRSVVLRVRHGQVVFLLTGDIEADAEESLDPGEVTVMKAPHHGSRTSSTEAFLARTRPKVAVFCVGRHSRFKFPSPEVEARYEAMGAQCYRTDHHGAVRIESDGQDVTVTTFLTPEPPPRPPGVADVRFRPQFEGDAP